MEHYGVQIDEIIERYPDKPEYLIFLLQDIQSSYGYISQDAMQQACDRTGVPLTQLTMSHKFLLDTGGAGMLSSFPCWFAVNTLQTKLSVK